MVNLNCSQSFPDDSQFLTEFRPMSQSLHRQRSSKTKSMGYELLRYGTVAEEQKDNEKALQLYQEGIGVLLDVLKSMKSEGEREKIRGIVEQYLSRAEYLRNRSNPSKRKQLGSKRSAFTKSIHTNVQRPKANVTQALRQAIEQEILDSNPGIQLDDVIGLADVKQCLYEAIVLPALNPHLFQGLRAPPKGILLFGPPGNGKTMIAKAVASSCNASFFNVSASSLTSRYVGEAEKLVKALFAIAREKQPSIIFVDEIDSILSSRTAEENEASRRLKTEFLVSFDGVGTDEHDKVLVMAASNLPQMLDDAIRRRFSKRIYVPLPSPEVRADILKNLLAKQPSRVSSHEINDIVHLTEGFSASDMKELCKEAAMWPLREMDPRALQNIGSKDIPAIQHSHLRKALNSVKPTVSPESLVAYKQWNDTYGTKVSPLKNSFSEENCAIT